MTQFALVKTTEKTNYLKKLSELEDDFLSKVAVELFPGVSFNEIWTPNNLGENIDCMMLSAQKNLIEKIRFQQTNLYITVKNIAEKADDFIFWYGSDYDDLDYICEESILLDMLYNAASSSFCELYIHYRRPKI